MEPGDATDDDGVAASCRTLARTVLSGTASKQSDPFRAELAASAC
jgi:hypothetical protein